MRNWYSELTNPIVYIREYVSPKRQETFLTKREPLTERQKLLKIVNTTHNKKHSDGRIYALSQDGSYSSHSVSPYAKSFLDNIEEKIKPLILALKDKNYLSISSCEGHTIYFKRYVTLVFPSKATALEFQSRLPFKKLKFNLRHCTEVLNNVVEHDEYGNILNTKKIEPFEIKERSLKENDCSIEYINCLIKRNYVDAWLLEVIISDQIYHEDGWGKYFKNWKEILFKKFFMERFTKKLTQFIEKKIETNIY
jgi:hypothetical protein